MNTQHLFHYPRVLFGLAVLLAAALVAGCHEVPVAPDLASEAGSAEALSKHKPGHGGGGSELGDAVVTVNAGDFVSTAGAIVDPDGGWRVGTDYDVMLDFDNQRGTSTSCPGVTFGLIEVGVKGPNFTEVIVRGQDGNGDQVTSGKQALAQPIPVPAPNTNFTLHVHLDAIAITRGRGQNAQWVCDVAVGDLAYAFQ